MTKDDKYKIAKAVEGMYSSYSPLGKLTHIPIIDTPFIASNATITDPEMKIDKTQSFLLCLGGVGLFVYYNQIAIKATFLYYSGRVLYLIMRLSWKNRTLFNACGYYLYKVLRETKNLKEARKMKGDNK